MYVTVLLIFGGTLLTLGDIVFKYWTGHEKPLFYLLGLAFYLFGLVFLIESYKFKNIEAASALLVLFNIVILTIVGWLYFHEKIGLAEVSGLFIAGIAILLLSFKG